MLPIELYAELLTNIRTVTLVASLQTASNRETKAEVSADRQTITVNHDGHSASIRLPIQMTGGGTAALTIPATPAKDLTLRLRVEEKAPGLLKFENGSENLVPWPASAMRHSIQCRECDTALLRTDAVTDWKDLPNENWAEMMDFWHCHKPHEDHHDHDSIAKLKGYSSSNKFQATSGTGLVGLSYILLAAVDCVNIEESSNITKETQSPSLQCSNCDAVLGQIESAAEGWKLYKWSLQLERDKENSEIFPVSKWISTQLLAAIENSGVRRFVVESASSSSEALLVWVFTDDVKFSSSVNVQKPPRHDPTRAMKIFYKSITNAAEVLEKNQFSHEQIVFPENIYHELKDTLVESALLLPTSVKKFQEWSVGLLERFDDRDFGGGEVKVAPTPEIPPDEKIESKEEAIGKIPYSEALLE